MLLDASLVLSDNQSITVTAPSSNYIDQLAKGDANVASWLVIRVATAFTAAGSATLTADLECDDNTSFSSTRILWSSGAVAKATLIAGYWVAKVRIPLRRERYLRVNFTVATGPMTAGAVDVFFVSDADNKITDVV